MTLRRWEVGSEFHWLGLPPHEEPRSVPWSSGVLVSTGRDALRLVLELGVTERGRRRLWVPEYFCQRVVGSLTHLGMELLPYPDHPLLGQPAPPPARPGDVVLLMNYFGLRGPVVLPPADGVEIVEDHSHDPDGPWAADSQADFCIASLRKTLPVPDGGVLWSPRGHALPASPALTEQRSRAAAVKLEAMVCKAMYLQGNAVAGERYRALQVEGEELLGQSDPSAPSDVSRALLSVYPTERWRRARAQNHTALRRRLRGVSWARVLLPWPRAGVPFGCAVLFDSADRCERVRRGLIAARVFPATLWSLERTVLPAGATAVELSRRILLLHCDARYRVGDMHRVAGLLIRSGGGSDAADSTSDAVLNERCPIGGEEALVESR